MFTVRNLIIFRVWLMITMLIVVVYAYSHLRMRESGPISYAQPNQIQSNQENSGARIGRSGVKLQDQDSEAGIHWDPMNNW